MGALASPFPWLPQDDLLLKNSIEAGASLESLARGAVEFSQKFTIKELLDRWQSLLYDPAVSAQACARMTEYELSAAQSKSKKTEISKESKVGDGKRKAESVRSCYYAMRKRVCNEPLYHGDLSFLMDNCFIDGAGATCVDGVVEHPLENNFGVEDGSFDLYNACASVLGEDFLIGQQNPFEDPMDQNTLLSEQIPPNALGDCNRIGEKHPAEQLYDQNIFEVNNIEAKPACNNQDVFSDCGTSYGHLKYSASMPEMAAWKAVESMLLPDTPDGVGTTGNNVQTVAGFGLTDANDALEGTSEDAAIHLQSLRTNRMSFEDLQISTGCTDDPFADISDIKFNDDEMHVNDDGNDEAFLDGLNTLLLDTLDYATDDELCNMPEMEERADDVFGTIPVKGVAEKHMRESYLQSCSGNQTSSATTFNLRFPEYSNGVICCVLNTEDPEIPCNDDIIFPSKRPASGHKKSQNKATVPPSSGKDNTGTQVIEKGVTSMNKETELIKKSHSSPNLVLGLQSAVNSFGVEIETQMGEAFNGSRILPTGYGSLCPSGWAVKKEHPDLPGCDIAEKSNQITESNNVQMYGEKVNQETQQKQSALNFVDPILEEQELVSSEHEEQFADSDADIPSFSDVESMILDMDLLPADQDAFYATKVAKYQQEDAMKAIIRLEQNAHSYMQRDMASHGAFAVLCGRHSKHYIKKLEVLLGRMSDGVKVDIDLTREGHANKISRRQASIKMDRSGSFSLKNLGRCPIYVNNEEILPGQRINLYSDCLIEIRGMPFIFEVNEPRVKLYLDNVVR